MSSTENSEPAVATPAQRWLRAAALLALFVSALVLFTQHNRYPVFYHPDEWGKARQIVDGTKSFNFNHPLLLLNVAKPLKQFWGRSGGLPGHVKLQHAVEAGRTASAIFAAIAVVALAVAGYVLAGPGGAIGVALVTPFHRLLFEHAHIFKEDAAVTMGLALTIMAAVLFWKSPSSPGRAVLLGLCTALAISAKYVGATALLIALPVMLFAPGERHARRLGIFAAALLITIVIANRQMFTHLDQWRKSLDREVGASVEGHRGLVAQAPVSYYVGELKKTVPTAAVIFLALNAFNLVTTARRRSLCDWLIFIFPFAFTAMLMMSPKISDRYILPAAVLFNFNACVGVGLAAEWLTRALGKYRFAGQCAFAALALLIGWSGQFGAFRKTYGQFKTDDRRELETWIVANLPAGAIVAQDAAVGLPDPDHHKQKGMTREFPLDVLGSEFVPDLGTLDELRAKGVRYVATTPKKSQRYTSGGMVPSDEVKDQFERRKAFYAALPQQAKRLWNRPMLEIDTLHPGLELYDLDAKP